MGIYKNNILLKIGGISFLLSFMSYLIIKPTIFETSRNSFAFPLSLFILIAILIAPIIEEATFRGIFTKNRTLRIISMLSTIIILIASFNFWPVYFLLFIYLFLFFLKKELTLCILNASFFAVIHFKIDDFKKIDFLPQLLFYISIGLILIWFVKNFGLVKGIILHSLWNFLLIIIMLFSLQFPDQNLYSVNNKNFIFKFKKEKLLKNNISKINYQENKITVDNIEPINLYKTLTLKHNLQLENFKQKEPYVKYSFTLESKHKISQKEIDLKILAFLKNEKILIR